MKQWRIVMAVTVFLLVLFVGHFGISSPKPEKTSSKRKTIDTKQKVRTRNIGKVEVFKQKPELHLLRRKGNYTVTVSPKKSNKSNLLNLKSKCWEKEKFEPLAECKRCHQFEKRKLPECQKTGNIQHVKCKPSGKEGYKSCPHVRWFEIRKFWIFEAGIFIVFVCSGFMVWHRSRELEAKFYEKLNKQVSDNV